MLNSIAKTGSGKTLTFLVPVSINKIYKILKKKKKSFKKIIIKCICLLL